MENDVAVVVGLDVVQSDDAGEVGRIVVGSRHSVLAVQMSYHGLRVGRL